jgi:sugar phosphate isomerase/epimerase
MGGNVKAEQVALQLYTVRAETTRDFAGTLRALGAMGYRAVEFAGFGNLSAGELRAVLDEAGIQAMGAHVQFNAWESNLDGVFADLHTLGCAHAVVPALPPEWRNPDAARLRELAGRFNDWGRRSQAEGLRFSYHNHAFEFVPLAGATSGTFYEALAGATDPALVGLELDVFWAQAGGHDPIARIERYAGRLPLIHVKDMTGSGDTRADAPVGEGDLPWRDILAAGDAAGGEWYIVEQDHPRDAMDDVRTSLRNLEKMAG